MLRTHQHVQAMPLQAIPIEAMPHLGGQTFRDFIIVVLLVVITKLVFFYSYLGVMITCCGNLTKF
jgi:hypothetical protein